jgi:hypothetical protein
MRRGCVAFLTLSLLGLALVGCGRFGGEQRAAWRTEAEEACLAQKLVQPTAYMSRISEIEGPGACGITYPFKVSAFSEGAVRMTNRVTLGCPMIPRVDAWLLDTVQPAAELYFGTTVTDVRAGTYSCRTRNHQAGAKKSEHAFGNAIDVMSFVFSDGREITVLKGWRGDPVEQAFLREVFVGACGHFTTVLGPGADAFHYDHFHLDLARHDARGQRRICKPIIKFEPRLDPNVVAVPQVPRPRPAIRPLPEPEGPLEIDDEDDPYVLSSRPVRPADPARHTSAPVAIPPARPPASATAYAGGPTTMRPGMPVDPYRDARPVPPARGSGSPVVLQPHLLTGQGVY